MACVREENKIPMNDILIKTFPPVYIWILSMDIVSSSNTLTHKLRMTKREKHWVYMVRNNSIEQFKHIYMQLIIMKI